MFYFIHKYSGGFDMLFLSEQEMWQSVTLEDVMDAIEDAYAIHKSGNYKMPDRFIWIPSSVQRCYLNFRTIPLWEFRI